jgi:hypothetical protein
MMKADGATFRETQRFTWPLLLVLIPALGGFAAVYGLHFSGRTRMPATLLVALPLFWTALIAFLAAMRLDTTVERDALVARFFPLRTRRVPFAEIVRAEAVTYRPIREYGGWGIRWAGPRKWAYNVSGRRGVLLTLRDGGTFLVGSRRAEELAGALARAGVRSA